MVKYWGVLFGINFALGVATGLTMEFQFGTNWAVFSDKAGPVVGPLMAYEVLSAFFLEAGFLGIMLFGRERVGEGLHMFGKILTWCPFLQNHKHRICLIPQCLHDVLSIIDIVRSIRVSGHHEKCQRDIKCTSESFPTNHINDLKKSLYISFFNGRNSCSGIATIRSNFISLA